jgi:cytochrome c oxidase subunit 3
MNARPLRVTPFDDPRERFAAGTMGMWFFLVVLGVFFASTMIAFVVVRLDLGDSADWSRSGDPPLPRLLLLSTLVLGLSSIAMGVAQRQANRAARALGALRWTLGLGGIFLVLQAFAWLQLWREDLTPRTDLYGWTFYVLTGLHAAHLVGGVGLLAWVLWRQGDDPQVLRRAARVRYAAMYWHFLGVGWLAFYGLLWWASR